MKHVNFKADLSEWNLKELDNLDNAADKIREHAEKIDEIVNAVKASALTIASEALQYIFEDDETYITFPAIWHPDDGCGGKAPSDPLTVYLRVGMESGGEKPTFSFNLRDDLKTAIDVCRKDGSFSDGLEMISAALKVLAVEIDKAVEKGRKTTENELRTKTHRPRRRHRIVV